MKASLTTAVPEHKAAVRAKIMPLRDLNDILFAEMIQIANKINKVPRNNLIVNVS